MKTEKAILPSLLLSTEIESEEALKLEDWGGILGWRCGEVLGPSHASRGNGRG